MCYCYLHIFPNSKIYVGTTQKEKVEDRWKKDGYGYKRQPFMWNAICKYGWENVRHKVIECETPEKMWEMEKELIKEYDTTNPEHGYNCSLGGESGSYGFHYTEESRKKMSENYKGEKNPFYNHHHTEEAKRKNRDAHKDKHPTESTRKKLSEANKGKKKPPFTEEHKRRISESKKGTPPWNKGKTIEKLKWITPYGEIKYMSQTKRDKHHPDWILIQNKE